MSSKREKLSVSVSTMNPVNEEDETLNITAPSAFDETEETPQIDENDTTELPFDSTAEQQKIRQNIEIVFKSLPLCQEITNLDKDNKRLDALEQLLIDRLVYCSKKPDVEPEEPAVVRPSSAAFSSEIANSYLSQDPESFKKPPVKAEIDPTKLDLNNLQLTNDSISEFSRERLLAQVESGLNNKSESLTSDQINMTASAKAIRNLNLTRNKFNVVPMNLLAVFRKVESLDLSENNFEYADLVELIAKSRLKNINLSGNLLKTLEKPEMTSDEAEQKRILISTTSGMKNLERLNLANNKLDSLSCMLLADLESLKYLNLSNNEFQLNPLANNFVQMPWQCSQTRLTSLLELDLSKNNKSPLTDVEDPAMTVRSGSTMSNYSSMYSNTPRTNKKSNSRLLRHTYFFNRLMNLRVLNLAENNLHNMPSDIKDLKNLEELYLDDNFLEFLPNELTGLKMLRILSASGNQITELNKSFCSSARFRSNLQKLNLSRNKLKNSSFSYKIGLFQQMTHLDLSENAFELVPNPLPKNLIELNLTKNRIKSLMIIPMSIQERSDEEILNALGLKDKKSSMNHMSNSYSQSNFDTGSMKKSFVIDESMYDEPDIDKGDELQLPHVFFLRNLRRLYLTDNLIGEIPADFGILNSKLEFIDLGRNQLRQIDVALCRGLVGLKYLNLMANQIRELPDRIRELSDLEYLNISHNLLVSLNYELCNSLKNLKELYLNNNSLEAFIMEPTRKRSMGRQFFGSNSESSISNITLSTPVKFVFNLPSLSKLNVSSNKFTDTFSFYKSFGLLSKLTDLDLSSNLIEHIDLGTHDESLIDMSLSQAQIDIDNIGEKSKNLSKPKHRLYELKSINLSNNQIKFNKGGFLGLLCNLSKLAPNLSGFIYNQKDGVQLKPVSPDENESFFFESDDPEFELEPQLVKCLKKLDLSHNSLSKIPAFVFNLDNLKEIFFNGNSLRKIPNEMYQKTLEDNEAEFKELQRIQIEAEKELKRRERRSDDEDVSSDDEEAERLKRKKKKKQKFKVDPVATELTAEVKKPPKIEHPLLSDHLEVLQLNENLIEHIPENFFASFKSLNEVKLENNPLKEPPQSSVCINSKLTRNGLGQNKLTKKPQITNTVEENTISLLESANKKTMSSPSASSLFSPSSTGFLKSTLQKSNDIVKKSGTLSPVLATTFSDSVFNINKKSSTETSELNLPNLFFENEHLKPLQSYMVHHKKREDMLLCNMFLVIKDTIDTRETLLKILRRLKMPMDKVDYVCKEIQNSVTKNWSKIAEIEYPPVPGKLSPSRKEMMKRMREYMLKLQTWNLLNAWRNSFAPDAPSDELVRILRLMNCTERENIMYERVFKLKCSSNMFRI